MSQAASSRGQVVVEYLLTSLAILCIFTLMYLYFGNHLAKRLGSGAKVILATYAPKAW
ncbi:MAG: hypothetical protein NTW04_00295 [Elusimicrobia bacterium]|nr:hypothetical protein [Elusimicrobiota bacterium]